MSNTMTISASIQFYNGGTKVYTYEDGDTLSLDTDYPDGIGSISFSGQGNLIIAGNAHSMTLSQKVIIEDGVNLTLDNVNVVANFSGNVTLKNGSYVTINGKAYNNSSYYASFTFDNTKANSTLNVVGGANSESIYNANINIYNLTPGDSLIIGDTNTKTVVWKKEDDGSYTLYKEGAEPSFPIYMKILGGIHLADGITPAMFSYDESAGKIVCYLKGTKVLTSLGYVPVEALTLNMKVMVNGKPKPIIWIGSAKAKVDVNNPYKDFAGYPIVIKKGALGKNMPDSDLYVTNEHCLFMYGVFIPVRMLVNGHSIDYVKLEEYEYFHFELEEHSIVTVNNIQSESYLNTGNRGIFKQKPPENDCIKYWEKDAAAPLGTSPELVSDIYQSLIGNDAQTLRETKKIYIESGKNKITPFKIVNGRFLFMVPAGDLAIVFNKVRHCDLIGPWFDDRREVIVTDINFSVEQDSEIGDTVSDKEKYRLPFSIEKACMVSVTF